MIAPKSKGMRARASRLAVLDDSEQYARTGLVDHQTVSFDAYVKFIEDDFLQGQRLDPKTDGRPDPRPNVRENNPELGDLRNDFDFSQAPLPAVILPTDPQTDLN